MVHVRLVTTVETRAPHEVINAVTRGELSELTQVSFDGGATWTTAAAAMKRLREKPYRDWYGLRAPASMAWWASAVFASALLYLFFFGAPVTLLATLFAWDWRLRAGKQVLALLFGVVAGPLALGGFGWWLRRIFQADASVQGRWRASFVLGIAALLMLALFIAFARFFSRAHA